MISLIDILKEVEEEKIDLSALRQLDDEIKKELDSLPKKEIVGTAATVSIMLALPGIVKAIAKIIETIAKKNGIQLKKSDQNNPKWYEIIKKTADKLDDYVDVPFKKVLSLFIQDENKRDKVAKILKAVVLTTMAVFGSVNVNQIESTTSIIKNLVPEISSELIQSIAEKNAAKIGTVLKNAIKSLQL